MNVNINVKDLFNPNSYSSKAMPLCDEICTMLDDEIGVSDEIKECRKKNNKTYHKFIDSLSPEQSELYDDYYWAQVEENAISDREYFSKGMRLGAALMMELLGGMELLNGGVEND